MKRQPHHPWSAIKMATSSPGPSGTASCSAADAELQCSQGKPAKRRKVAHYGPCQSLEEVPHSGRLFLDQGPDGKQVLTDVITHEAHELGEEYELIMDPGSGFGVLASLRGSQESGDVVQVDKIMKKRLFKSSTGELFLVTSQSTTLEKTSMDFVMSQFRQAEAKFSFDSCNASGGLILYVFKKERASLQRCFWDLFKLYKMLKMTQYRGQASKWVWNLREKWATLLSDSFGRGQIIMSCHGNQSNKVIKELEPAYRCLPNPAISTVGLLTLLSRFAFNSKKHGGLDNDTQREGAGELLKLLLKQAVDFPQKRTFTIGLYDIWECPWPRPCLARSHGVQET